MPFSRFNLIFVILHAVTSLFAAVSFAEETDKTRLPQRWAIDVAGGISWNVADAPVSTLPHRDSLEMSGRKVAGIVKWSIDKQRQLTLERTIFFPQLHPVLKTNQSKWGAYRSYLQTVVTDDHLPRLFVNSKRLTPGRVEKVSINGYLEFTHQPVAGLRVVRRLFPSTEQRAFLEMWTLVNETDAPIIVGTGTATSEHKTYGWGKNGTSQLRMLIATRNPPSFTIAPGKSHTFSLDVIAAGEGESIQSVNATDEFLKRQAFLKTVSESLILETPDPVLDELFRFSKIRASESIYDSELGLIHSPGGGRYYVGIWANDQAEYVNPFFAYLGYDLGHKSAMNCYRAFSGEMNSDYRPMRYAFEIEGLVPPIILDRGDAAMIAYGATHYGLASGDRDKATELWPLIEWCLEYCDHKRNANGVIESQSDEMEGRLKTGDANLSTSSLYYGALKHAVDLSAALDLPAEQREKYSSQAKSLAAAIESHFGSTVEGLETYRYYDGHEKLRHWICLPLVVGIDQRTEGTVEGLFDRLWTENGIHVEKNNPNPKVSNVFWDRGTLYALRGTFIAGETERSLQKLTAFSRERLLGRRVPYVVEAFPEGNMAHLSAESGLYCRAIIEGMFGMLPTGLSQFSLTPRLPEQWTGMKLRHVKAFGHDFRIEVDRKDQQLNIRVIEEKSNSVVLDQAIESGETVRVRF